jgi:hypothetical protein
LEKQEEHLIPDTKNTYTTLEAIIVTRVFEPHIEYRTCIWNNGGYYGHNNNGEEGQNCKYTGKVPLIQNQQRKPAHE